MTLAATAPPQRGGEPRIIQPGHPGQQRVADADAA